MLFIESEGKQFHAWANLAWLSFILFFAFTVLMYHEDAKMQFTQLLLLAQQCFACLWDWIRTVLLNLFKFEAMGNVAPGRSRDAFLKVFNSTTVYLRKRWGRWGGWRRDAILVLTLLCGDTLTVVITWIMLWTCVIVAVCSICCRYGMSFFNFKSGYLYGWHLLSSLQRLIIYSLYNWCVCEHWSS